MPTVTTLTSNNRGQSPDFDKYAFRKYVGKIGRAYQKQARELVSICRTFGQAQQQSRHSDFDLRVY